MDPIAKLFGSAARAKLLRLFLFNEGESYTSANASERAKVAKDATRRELSALVTMGILKKRSGKGGVTYTGNQKFAFYEPLRLFLRTASGVDDATITSSIKKAGTVRLLALSGLFTNVPESKVDILIVGDRMDDRGLATIMRGLEAEMGRELRYASFSTEDFRYRVGVYDRLVRDVLEYPHRLVLDKIGI